LAQVAASFWINPGLEDLMVSLRLILVIALATACSSSSSTPSEADAAGSSVPDSAIGAADAAQGDTDVAADVTNGDAPSSDGVSAFLSSYAAPFCARMQACCSQVGLTLTAAGLSACKAKLLSPVETFLRNGSEAVSPSGVRAALAAIQSSCNQPSGALTAAVVDGTSPPAGPCQYANECKGDPAACIVPIGGGPGLCSAPKRGVAGDSCIGSCDDTSPCKVSVAAAVSSSAVCYERDGLVCDAVVAQCVAITATGSSCMDSAQCGVHATCTIGSFICQPLPMLNGDCSGGGQCDANLQCSPTTYTCGPIPIGSAANCN
jgi:hypothetical protein